MNYPQQINSTVVENLDLNDSVPK
jgi:hypothetical protein